MSDKNVATVRSGYEAFGRGDMEALFKLFDENIEWVAPGPPELPTAGHRRGLQQVKEFFQAVDEVFEIQRMEPQTFVSQGDMVVVLGTETVKVKETGNVHDGAWAHAFKLKNGKVVHVQEYVDTSTTVSELHAAHARA